MTRKRCNTYHHEDINIDRILSSIEIVTE